MYDSLVLWWQQYARTEYSNAQDLLILCDGGGSNSCRHYVFKQTIQQFANYTQLTVTVAHYPSYCSKYNPIEHRVFPYVTQALQGVVLDKVETVKQLIDERAHTKTGLQVFSNIIEQVYHTGKKATQQFLQNMPIIFETILPRWNYKAVPIS